MPKLVALSSTQHAQHKFKRYSSYQFAASDAVAPLVAHEVARACMGLPVGFIKQGEQTLLVAVLGLQAQKNLFVAPDGRWIGDYVPAVYRGYPFALVQAQGSDQQVLCIDEDSGLLSPTEGEALFGEDGKPSKVVSDILNFLSQVNGNRAITQKAVAALDELGLIQPWPITIKTEQGENTVQGLLRVDEEKLNALPAESLKQLQAGGGLGLAYAQLLSMQHVQKLGQLAQAHQQAAQQAKTGLPVNKNGELDLEFLNQGGTLSFGD